MIPASEIRHRHLEWQRATKAGDTSARRAIRDALQGCAEALQRIAEGLKQLRYPVEDMLTPCPAELDELVEETQGRTGRQLPPVLVEFWRTVGGVALVDLDGYAHVDFWEERGVSAEYCDGLLVEACTHDWVEYIVGEHEQLEADAEFREPDSFIFLLSPDGYHKDDISGGLPYGLRPGSSWQPTWENFHWATRPASAGSGAVDFMGYLRTAVLECAGFPGLLGDASFEPVRQALLKDVKGF